MSDPKSYSPPPPRYSANVFDGKLHEIFSLQTKIKTYFDTVLNFSAQAKKENIASGCIKYAQKNMVRIKDLTMVFTLNLGGSFGQSTYDRLEREISEKIGALKKLLNEVEDFSSLAQYEMQLFQAKKDLIVFKSHVVDYLAKHIQSEFPNLYSDSVRSINNVDITIPKADFEHGFRNFVQRHLQKIEHDVNERKSEINNYRAEVSKQVLGTIKNSDITGCWHIDGKAQNANEEVENLINELNEFISNIYDVGRQESYKKKLRILTEGSFSNDTYYYKELLNELREAERYFLRKEDIHKGVLRLNKINEPKSLQASKSNLLQACLATIEKDRVKVNEHDDIMGRIDVFLKKTTRIQTEEEIIKKEHVFLKAQLIQILIGMNYEVMDNMNVVDFEKESDFLLSLPQQDNYLNLRFNEDGSFLYNFLIPENKKDLSQDQQQIKINEMNSTCQEFKSVLNELAGLGLNIDLAKEMPATEKGLIQVPNKYQDKVRPHKARKKEGQARQMLQVRK